MIDFSTTFNKFHPKAVTFHILFSCRPEIHRVETPETLNQGRFKSEVTQPSQITKHFPVSCRYKGDIICSYVCQKSIVAELKFTWYKNKKKQVKTLEYEIQNFAR